MANALNILSPEAIDRNGYAVQATDIVEEYSGSILGVITSVRNRPERPKQHYENSWLVAYGDKTVYLTGLTLCEPDDFWDADSEPVTATVFTPDTAETAREQYDRALYLEETFHDPHLSDENRAAILDRYDAQFFTATPDAKDSLRKIFSHLESDSRDDGSYHAQLGGVQRSRFDRHTASELLEKQET